jgi:two-component system response regulator
VIVTQGDTIPDVVLIEDNEEEARISLMGLRRIDPRPTVMIVNDGEAALNLLTGNNPLRPRLVLLDLKLPKVNGLDILAAIKSKITAAGFPVLIFTSSDHPSDVTNARELGCDAYLCKPVDWEKYIRLICSETAARLQDSVCREA